MVRTVLYRTLKRTLHIALIFSIVSLWQTVRSQSVLLPGDVVTVSVNAEGHVFDIVPLVDVEKGTRLYFSSGQWIEKEQELLGDQLQLTFDQDIEAGTAIRVSGKKDPRYRIQGYLNWNQPDKRLLSYQLDQEQYRFIYAVGWGESRIWDRKGEDGSDIPLSLSMKDKTILELGQQKNYQYFLRNGASGTRRMILSMVSDPDHWTGRDSTYDSFGTNFSILEPPVVQFDRSVSRIGEAGEYASLNVAIFEHDGSRLTVDVIYDTLRSNAGSEDVEAFRKATINFTGIIGDRVYEIQVPLKNDEEYEGVETAIFSLGSLSGGNLGDYFSHSLVIEDNEIPSLSLHAAVFDEGNFQYLELKNNEPVPVSLNNWSIGDLKDGIRLRRSEYIEPGSRIRLVPQNEYNRYEVGDLVISDKDFSERIGKTDRLIIRDDRGEVVIDEDLRSYRNYLTQSEDTENLQVRTSGSQVAEKTISGAADIQGATVSSVRTGQWYFIAPDVVRKADLPADMDFFYWDESEGEFKEYSAAESSTYGVLLSYAEAGNEDKHMILTELSQLQQKESASSWDIQASDRDKNGEINGSEGVNWLIQNSGADLTAAQIIALMQREGVSADPALYDIRTSNKGKVRYDELRPDQTVGQGTPFIIRLTEAAKPQAIAVQMEEIGEQPMAAPISDEDEPQLILQFAKDNLTTEWSAVFGEGSDNKAPAYAADEAFIIPGQEYLFAYSSLGDTDHRKVRVSTETENEITLPLNLQTNVSGEVTLWVKEMSGLPSGWAVFLRDREEGNEYTLRPDKKIVLRIQREEQEEVTDFSLPAELPEREISDRFELLFSPPIQVSQTEEETDEPQQLELFQNYPNPFNPITTISFYLPESSQVRLSVYNIVGQPVATLIQGSLSAGRKTVEWDATDMPSGMYLYKLEVGNRVMTRKMTLVK